MAYSQYSVVSVQISNWFKNRRQREKPPAPAAEADDQIVNKNNDTTAAHNTLATPATTHSACVYWSSCVM